MKASEKAIIKGKAGIFGELKHISHISALVEGNSLRATSRMTGVSKVTILRLLEFLGTDFARALLSNSDGNFELAPPA